MISDLQRELRDMYSAQNYDEAIDLVRDLERITTEFYGENHPVTVSSINNHALLKRATGEYASAVELFTTAIQKYEKSVGKDHTSTATALHNLGLTYKSMYESGDHTSMEQIQLQDRAEEALRESMSRRAEDHVDRATTMYVLASVRSTQVREFTRSRKFCCAGCICKFSCFFAFKFALLLSNFTSSSSSSSSKTKQGKPEESAELFENALAVLREAYSASKESKVSGMRLATGLNNYGYWMKMEGQYNEALVMYQESFEMRERHAGKDDVSTIISLQNIAELLTSMESDDEANIVRKEIMERVERLKQE